ncbi:MAG: undecaprenyldiphospho-muramoylpentapeptide beta-N-acetylglucosaminyltransferase [Arenicella sp.]
MMNEMSNANRKVSQKTMFAKVKQTSKTVVIMAGGTGGHVFPALAVAKELQQDGVKVVWLGTRAGIESRLVPDAGYPIHYLSVSGLVGSGWKRKLKAPFMLMVAVMQSINILRKEKPQCVLGMGGFASGPGGLAAKLLGKRIIIHEQNAYAGFTNQKLSSFADSILTGFRSCEGLPETSIWVGNPVRPEIAQQAKQASKKTDKAMNLLILGGSQGAKSLNDALPDCLASIAKDKEIRVWHQTGAEKSESVNARYQKLSNFKSVLVEEFIHDINVAYAWADLVVCRAGAMTISELMAAGKPAILVPFPHAAGDHQTKNARFMVNSDAAVLAADDSLTSNQFVQQLKSLLISPERLQQMSQNSADLHRSTAARQVADFCMVYLNA